MYIFTQPRQHEAPLLPSTFPLRPQQEHPFSILRPTDMASLIGTTEAQGHDMDPYASVWAQFAIPPSPQSHYVAQRAYEPYTVHLAPDSTLQPQPQDRQFFAGSLDPVPTFSTHEHHDAESAGNTQSMPASPMGPPSRPRKRKAPIRRADDWEPYKARILELHIAQKLPLNTVKEKIRAQFGFTAE